MKPSGAEAPVLGFVFVWVLSLLSALPLSAQAESLEDLGAIVRTQQTRSFSDLELLRGAIAVAPTVEVTNAQGSSPSQLIKRIYGFGSSDSQEAYNLMQARILALNNKSDATQLPTGRIIVPDMPILTSRMTSPVLAEAPVVRNSSPTTALSSSRFADAPRFAYSKPLKIRHPLSRSLSYSRIDIYSAEEAAQLQAIAATTGAVVEAGTEKGIQLADTGTTCSDTAANVLNTEDTVIVTNAVKSATGSRERYVVVLDTGWPTYEHQIGSLRTLRRIFDAVRAGARVPTAGLSRFNPELPANMFAAPTHVHACMIQQSLREFVAIDPKAILQVIYVPLRPGQWQSRELFQEIIELDQLLLGMGNPFSRSPEKLELSNARDFANTALANLKALKDPWIAGDDVVAIYDPLVSGLIRILDFYTQINPVTVPGQNKVDARFWLSLSWNYMKFTTAPSLPSSTSYMVFAAAGNDNVDFVAGKRLFASEAVNNHRVFAVMNNDESSGSLTCGSAQYAKVWDENNLDMTIASFPGRLSPLTTARCPGQGGGTSFSTPRLAWLSAAADIVVKTDEATWIRDLGRQILKSRLKIDADPGSAPISVKRLFNAN